jgi:prophage regulatory protein
MAPSDNEDRRMNRDSFSLIREKELSQRLGISSATLSRWERSGLFPKRIKVGKRMVGWRCSAVDQWLSEQEQATS